jgi:hypothetical protein
METEPLKLSDALEAMKLEWKQHARFKADKHGRKDPKEAMRPLDLAGNLIFNKPFIGAHTTIYLRLIAWGTPS